MTYINRQHISSSSIKSDTRSEIESKRHTHAHTDPTTVTLAAHARRGLMKCKPSANCACAVPLIDGVGYAFTRGLPLVARGRAATVVDSMQESIRTLRFDILCVQDAQSKRTRSR